MTTTFLPLYLLADSQLLFWSDKGVPFISSALQRLGIGEPAAAYIGASNGDSPEAYAIFVEAMKNAGIADFQMIRSHFPPEDRAFLEKAGIIVLAGGDVEAGWKVFNETGMKDLILKRYAEGALLIGVSAGAVQLGSYALIEKPGSATELINAFQLAPFIIGAHDEKRDWETLRHTIHLMEGTAYGIGIPSGGGLIFIPIKRSSPSDIP
jgi:cyanophycinase